MNKKILWVDDDINSFALRAYVDEFSDEGIEIEKINNPDEFQNALDTIEFDCLIMDMMMPTGEGLTLPETRGGLHTGLKLLEKNLAKVKSKPIIIFTVLNDETVREWATKNDVEYKLKQNATPSALCSFVQNLLNKVES